MSGQFHSTKLLVCLGSDCSTAIEHTPRNLEVVGSNLARCQDIYFFFYLFLLSNTSGVSLIRFLKDEHLKLCVVKEIEKNGCLAELPGATQAEQAQIG